MPTRPRTAPRSARTRAAPAPAISATLFALLPLALCLALPAHAQDTPQSVRQGSATFDMRVVAKGLEGPWEVTYGPDDQLWVTERTGKRIVRIDPASGEKTVLATIDEVEAPGGQDGLLGLALDPELLQGTGRDYVYAAYTYLDPNRPADETVEDAASPYRHLFAKIVRFTYSPEGNRLDSPTEVIAGLPASNDHNSGRLKVGPDGMLYYTIGDQGNNQLGNWCVPIEAQRLPTEAEVSAKDYAAYVGKSLRLSPDGTIPADNPEIAGLRSHVYTFGHRNMQGIAFGPDGTLYASEQGPKTDDEINILKVGGNYGWPHVAGFADDMAYVYARWAESENPPCADLTFSDIEIPANVPFDRETDWTDAASMTPPLATMFTVPNDWNFQDPACGGMDFICWPTIAASSIEYYPPTGGIPGWGNSLIIPTLKRGSLYHVLLSADGQATASPFERYFQSENRFRDTALSPDALTIFVATDPGGLAESASGGTTTDMQNPGEILAFTYNPDALPPNALPPGDSAAALSDQPTGTVQDDTAAMESDQSADPTLPEAKQIPTGQFLPATFTEEQVNDGKRSYNSACAACHGNTLANGTMGPHLAGQVFETKWKDKTVADLFTYSRDHMPPSRPRSLPDETYAAITAYILRVNGTEPGDQPLLTDPDALANQQIVIPNRD